MGPDSSHVVREAGLTVLEEPVPFPMNWSQADFVEGFRKELGLADGGL